VESIRLLIISDDSPARGRLEAIFAKRNTFKILAVFTMEEALSKAAALQPDAMLFDTPPEQLLPGFIEQLKITKQQCPCSRLLVLVDDALPARLAAAIPDLGADGLIPKNITDDSLARTVEIICRAGVLCLPAAFKKALFFSFSEAKQPAGCGEQQAASLRDTLTKREREVLALIAKDYSNRELARELGIGEPTVKTHVSSILRKLGISSRTQAVVYAYQLGLVSEN